MTRILTIDSRTGTTVTAVHYPAATPAATTVVLAHGAGTNQSSPFIVGAAEGLAARGLEGVTFNFPYTERGRKLPDTVPVLETCYRTVLEHVSGDAILGPRPLVIGGKSLGSRIATHLAAALPARPAPRAGWASRLAGVVCLGFPLHPAGKPTQVRVDHLPRVTDAMLIVQGSRDAFGTPAELRAFIDVLSTPIDLLEVDGGDHSFDVLKRTGRDQTEVMRGVLDAIAEWIGRHAAQAGR
jgi:uncharacterized protein